MLVDIAGVARRGALVAGDLAGHRLSMAVTTTSSPWWRTQTTSPRRWFGTEYSPPSKAITGVLAPTVRVTPNTAV